MKILMIAPQPFFTPRGTPFSVLYRLRALSELGHSVDLVTYHIGESPEIPGVTIHRISRVPGVRSVKIGPSPVKIILDLLLFAKAMVMAKGGGYDLLHTHEEAGLLGAFLSRLTGVRHVYDMHSSLPQQFGNFNAYNIAPVVGVFRLVEAATLAGSDGVITICPDLARHVQASGYDRPHRLIENTYTDQPDRGEVLRQAAELRRRHGLEGKRVVLYTGTLEAYQGLGLLVEAAAELAPSHPDVRFVVVGGRPEQVAALADDVARRGLQAAVPLIGLVPPAEIPAWLEVAELLVSPRCTGTNTPLKIYQYLKSGVPLVATDIHSHTQILDPQVARLVPPTAAGLAAGIDGLLRDPALAGRLAAAGLERAGREYSNSAYVRKMADLLSAVTGEPQPPGLGAEG